MLLIKAILIMNMNILDCLVNYDFLFSLKSFRFLNMDNRPKLTDAQSNSDTFGSRGVTAFS